MIYDFSNTALSIKTIRYQGCGETNLLLFNASSVVLLSMNLTLSRSILVSNKDVLIKALFRLNCIKLFQTATL